MSDPVRRTLALLWGRVGSTSAPSAPTAPGHDDDPARRAALEGPPAERDSEPMPALAALACLLVGRASDRAGSPRQAAGASMTGGAP
jgi:hypothetical protein